ncbi:DNA-binding transcriptional repressor FabR [compost metagenome]
MGDERKRYHHGDLRRGILEAALALLAERGVHALSVREAAQRAGVSPAAPYRHFPTKEALLAAIAAHGFDALAAALVTADQQHPGSLRDKLKAGARAYMGFAKEHPERFHVMYGGFFADASCHPDLLDACHRAEGALLAIFRAGHQELAPAEPDELLVATHAFLHGLGNLYLEGHLAHRLPVDEDAWLDRLVDLLWLGIGATGSKPTSKAARTALDA